MSPLNLYAINTAVKIGPKDRRDIPGIVTGIFIRESGVCYEVSFWDDRNYKQVTLNDFEIDFGSALKIKAGFAPADSK
jgi:hypothetical protein